MKSIAPPPLLRPRSRLLRIWAWAVACCLVAGVHEVEAAEGGVGAANAGGVKTVNDLPEAISKALVEIECHGLFATGFIFRLDESFAYIITAKHGVKNCGRNDTYGINVTLWDRTRQRGLRIDFRSTVDIAVIRINVEPSIPYALNLPSVASDKLEAELDVILPELHRMPGELTELHIMEVPDGGGTYTATNPTAHDTASGSPILLGNQYLLAGVYLGKTIIGINKLQKELDKVEPLLRLRVGDDKWGVGLFVDSSRKEPWQKWIGENFSDVDNKAVAQDGIEVLVVGPSDLAFTQVADILNLRLVFDLRAPVPTSSSPSDRDAQPGAWMRRDDLMIFKTPPSDISWPCKAALKQMAEWDLEKSEITHVEEWQNLTRFLSAVRRTEVDIQGHAKGPQGQGETVIRDVLQKMSKALLSKTPEQVGPEIEEPTDAHHLWECVAFKWHAFFVFSQLERFYYHAFKPLNYPGNLTPPLNYLVEALLHAETARDLMAAQSGEHGSVQPYFAMANRLTIVDLQLAAQEIVLANYRHQQRTNPALIGAKPATLNFGVSILSPPSPDSLNKIAEELQQLAGQSGGCPSPVVQLNGDPMVLAEINASYARYFQLMRSQTGQDTCPNQAKESLPEQFFTEAWKDISATHLPLRLAP